ncbi:MAG: hypothetical protein IMW91_08500 [Firmicutes bacterium]|nr:hypothetical protein [Bacillota bacterium]
MIRVAASIAAADQLRLGEEIERLQAAGVAALHVDVMDGHFVPNQMMGPDLVAALHHATALPLDVHLMVESPERLIDRAKQCRRTAYSRETPCRSGAPMLAASTLPSIRDVQQPTCTKWRPGSDRRQSRLPDRLTMSA